LYCHHREKTLEEGPEHENDPVFWDSPRVGPALGMSLAFMTRLVDTPETASKQEPVSTSKTKE
jgi:hypothetical protein